MKSEPGPRQCSRGRRAVDRLVQRLPASSRARSRRDDRSVRRRNARARLAQVLVCSWRGSRQVDMVARVKCARSPLLPPRIMSPQTVHCSSLVVAPTEGGPSGPQCLCAPVQAVAA